MTDTPASRQISYKYDQKIREVFMRMVSYTAAKH
jgi:hypothetical protein